MGLALLVLSVSTALAGNQFFPGSDAPVSAEFRGTEWGDKIEVEELPLRARVVTTRVAKTAWGEVLRISFEEIVSRAPEKRSIRALYFIVTDDAIYLFNEADPERAIEQLAKTEKPPEFDSADIRAISKGTLSRKDGPWETTLKTKGDVCEYSSSHNSGHFARMKWKKGVGLIEYANGSGARSDGYSLKRASDSAKKRP